MGAAVDSTSQDHLGLLGQAKEDGGCKLQAAGSKPQHVLEVSVGVITQNSIMYSFGILEQERELMRQT